MTTLKKSDFHKLSPTALSVLGLSPKSERYKNLATGDLISKRQYQKLTGVGSPGNKSTKNATKQNIKTVKGFVNASKIDTKGSKLEIAIEALKRESKKFDNTLSPKLLKDKNSEIRGEFDRHVVYSATAPNKKQALILIEKIQARFSPAVPVNIQLAFKFDQDFATNAKYKFETENEFCSIAGRKSVFNAKNAKKEFEELKTKGLKAKKNTKFSVKVTYLIKDIEQLESPLLSEPYKLQPEEQRIIRPIGALFGKNKKGMH